jgi:hypothetical protein
MARYSAEFSIAGVNSADGVLFNLKSGSADRIFVEQVFFNIEVASTNAPIYGLKLQNAAGTGTITTATIFKFDPADGAAAGSLETAWATTRPTVTGGSAVRGAVPNTIGNGFLFDFTNRPLVLAVSTGLCGVMRNASGATTGTHGGFVIWSE